jgi:4Fe-4S ferredoxin
MVYVFLLLLYIRLRPLFSGPRERMVVYRELCNGCGNCVVACPVNALRSGTANGSEGHEGLERVMDIKDGAALEFNMNLCERVTKPDEEPCRLCIDACPLNAIGFTY